MRVNPRVNRIDAGDASLAEAPAKSNDEMTRLSRGKPLARTPTS